MLPAQPGPFDPADVNALTNGFGEGWSEGPDGRVGVWRQGSGKQTQSVYLQSWTPLRMSPETGRMSRRG